MTRPKHVTIHVKTTLHYKITTALLHGYDAVAVSSGKYIYRCLLWVCYLHFKGTNIWTTFTLKMEAVRYFKTSVTIYKLSWHHIPENVNLHGRHF